MKRLLALFVLAACSQGQGKLPERDERREAQRYAAATKRQELSVVAGVYRGQLKSVTGLDQTVILNLEVKDLPESSAEGVDPVLVPKVVGHLRFQFGGEDSKEYVDAPVVESEYDPALRSVHLVVQHLQFDKMILQLNLSEEETILSGTWQADSVGLKGELRVEKPRS